MNLTGPSTGIEPRPREQGEVDAALIAKIVAVFVTGLAVSLLFLAWMFHGLDRVYFHRTSEAAPRLTAAALPPTPRLQTAPAADLQQVRAEEDRHLARYAWIDRSRGIAQIPIEHAMGLWVQTQGAAAAIPAANAPPVTELQMRQGKAQEANHAP